MSTFDSALRETCTVRMPRTNTPMQALTLMNDPTYVEAARVLAERILRHQGSTVERIQFAAQRLLGRKLNPTDAQRLASGYEEHLTRYQAAPEEAKALLAVGARPTASELDAAEHATFAITAMILLNLDTTLNLE